MALHTIKRSAALAIGFIFFCAVEIFSQNGFYVTQGRSVAFYFDSGTKYSIGIEYTNFTQLRVFNQGDHIDGGKWFIDAWLESIFDDGIPPEVVEISVDPGTNGTSPGGWIPLSNIATVPHIVDSDKVGNNMIINISYRIGTTESLAGHQLRYYPNTIVFHMYFY